MIYFILVERISANELVQDPLPIGKETTATGHFQRPLLLDDLEIRRRGFRASVDF